MKSNPPEQGGGEENTPDTQNLDVTTSYTEEELTAMTNSQLKSICDDLGVTYNSSATKATLVGLILGAQGGN